MNVPFDKTRLPTTLRKMGNSTGLIVPKAILDQLGLACGAKVDLRVENGEIVARPARRKVREGWEESARDVGKFGLTDEERDWLEFDDFIEDGGEIPREWLADEGPE